MAKEAVSKHILDFQKLTICKCIHRISPLNPLKGTFRPPFQGWLGAVVDGELIN